MLSVWRSASSCKRPEKRGKHQSSSICMFILPLIITVSTIHAKCDCVVYYFPDIQTDLYAGVCTLFHQEVSLDSVESLALPTSFLQLLLAVCQSALLLLHCPLVVLVNLQQLLVWTLEHLSRTHFTDLVWPWSSMSTVRVRVFTPLGPSVIRI